MTVGIIAQLLLAAWRAERLSRNCAQGLKRLRHAPRQDKADRPLLSGFVQG
jgi:hypothetical protein